jgi:hypothetical protein
MLAPPTAPEPSPAGPDYDQLLMTQEMFDTLMAEAFTDPWAPAFDDPMHHGALEPPDMPVPPMPEEQAFDQSMEPPDAPFPEPGSPMM